MRLVPVGCVVDGTALARDIMNSKGTILLKKGVVLNDALIKRVEENNVLSVYIDDEYSDQEINDIIKPEVRQKTVLAIKETFENIERANAHAKGNDLNLNKRLQITGMEKYMDNLKHMSKHIVEEMSSNRNILINLVDIKNIDTYTYQHSLNTAILSLILGIELKLRKEDLYPLFFGALMHDIGKAFLPRSVVNKRGNYTEDEMIKIKEHTQLGYDYLKEHYGVNSASKVVALQHHEKYDGTGYPLGMSGDHIHRFSRIVAIADCYDAMTSDSPNSVALPPNEAIEYIMGSAGSHFDFHMAEIFTRKVIPYPEGTLINLSSGQVAVVDLVNPNYPLRPRVKVLEQGKSLDELKHIDLMTEMSITITSIQYNDPFR